ncbi:MAG: tetratricopeptide repeat protein [Acidobacteria bacterium]|nr:tetratricopeptide repeat protein [Acidobacteriota bacterium]MBK8147537.1 tetratricopeptide repeat protein [Acidobacteriota bacterium]
MTNLKKSAFRLFGSGFVLFLFVAVGFSQQVQRAEFDVTGYKMDVQLSPNENKLAATVDVSFVPKADTRNVAFELNGSLTIESITKIQSQSVVSTTTATPQPKTKTTPKPAVPTNQLTFVQDRVGVSELGPSVKIDLGETAVAGSTVTLRFKYYGVLVTAEGGPLLTKRLAYVGSENGYLMYAARWFPFHNYAADFATSDITISIPTGYSIAGYSDQPSAAVGGKQRFVQSRPGLIGNFAYDRYASKTLRFGEFEFQFFTKAANDQLVSQYGETLGRAFDFYTKKYGLPESGRKFVIAQIDDDSLEFYSAPGVLFVAQRLFDQSREVTAERMQREAAYQWWGLSAGLKSFDDAWLSQGLAEYSAFSLRESQLTGPALESLRRELLEKALTFEPTASLLRAPSSLDDQSTAYQYIMFAKGAFAYKLLRDTLGDQKFDQLLRAYLERYRGKNASIDDFEKLTSEVAGQNMRYFFARWVESTGVPEFKADYLIIRTRAGKFVTRGTVRQNYDNLRLPLEIQLRSEGGEGLKTVTVNIEEASADFNIESDGKPLELIIDPNYKLLRISDELRISSIARRGIEQFKEGNYVEAQQQFEQALKLDRSNAWIYYHLGLLFLEQRNYDLAIDNFKAVEALGVQGDARPAWLHVWALIKKGNAYDAKGDRTRAMDAYNKGAALGDNYDNAQEVIKRYQDSPYDPRDKTSTTAVK